jgi:hypothetical protein
MPLEITHDDAAADVNHPGPLRTVDLPASIRCNRLTLDRFWVADRRDFESAPPPAWKREQGIRHPAGRAIVTPCHLDAENASQHLLGETFLAPDSDHITDSRAAW